jgi:hypothetical protein
VHAQAVRARAFATVADGSGLEDLGAQRRPVRNERLHRDLEMGPLVQRGLLDLGGDGRVRRSLASGENPTTCCADGLEVGPQAPQEERLADDRRGAPAFGMEHVEDGALDRLGLPAGITGRGARLHDEEELPSLGTFHPSQDDPAAVPLEPLGRGMTLGG